MRGTRFEEMSFYGSLGRKEVVGALLSRGKIMVLVFRRRLGRNVILSLLLLSSLRGMEGDFAFGRMLGVGKRPFQFYYPALFAFAANKEVSIADVWEPSREGGGGGGGFGLLVLLGLLMIGKLRRFKNYSKLYKIKEFFQTKMI